MKILTTKYLPKTILLSIALISFFPSSAFAADKALANKFDVKNLNQSQNGEIYSDFGILPKEVVSPEELRKFLASRNQAVEAGGCATKLKTISQPAAGFSDESRFVEIQLCVENIVSLDSEFNHSIGMPAKTYSQLANSEPKCKVDAWSSLGAKIWLVSDSDILCNTLVAAKTTHPQVTVTGLIHTYFSGVYDQKADGTLELNKVADYPLAFVGLGTVSLK